MAGTATKRGEKLTPEDLRSHPYFVSTLEKGMRVLKAFYAGPGSLSLTDICKITGLEKSAVQRLTYTLVELGYLFKNDRTKQYYLSPQLLDFSYMYLHSDPLIMTAAPYLIDARGESREAINLGRMIGTDVIYTFRIPPRRSGRNLTPIPGSRSPVFCTATGRSILSRLPEAEVSRVLDETEYQPLTSKTILDRDEIMLKIENARDDGFAIAVEECRNGEITVAAPLVNQEGLAIAAINISVMTNRWDEAKVRTELAPIIVHTALEISHAQGFSAAAGWG